MRPLYLTVPALLLHLVIAEPAWPGAGIGVADTLDQASAQPCPEGVISTLTIDNRTIFDTGDPGHPRVLRLAYRVANALHTRTRASVIRRDLLFRQGDCYDPILISESERLLRDNQFLASARIVQHRRPDGDYDLVVETRDEWSARVDLRLSLSDGLDFQGLSFRESNFLGRGQLAELYYLDYAANRSYGAGFHTHQLGGRQWHLGAELGGTRLGPLVYQSLAYPFREETGRWAAREEYRQSHRFFNYLIDDAGTEHHLLLPTRTRAFDLAALHRFGRPGNHFTLGVALSHNEITFPGGTSALELVRGNDYDDPLEPDSAQVQYILGQARPQRSLRALLLLGRRRVTWTKRQGFDTMRGDQDIRLGTELGLAIGRSLTSTNGPHHLFTAIDLYTASGTGDLLWAAQLKGDAQRFLGPYPGGAWNDLFAEAETQIYWKPMGSEDQTLVLRAIATGGWRTLSPFQLTLGGDLGVRGYRQERFPGGRRLLVSLEDRFLFPGPLRELMDLGATIFFDLGRTWPGDAPYGIDSGWRAAAGVGIRNALPSGGRRTYRIDLALPIQQGAGWKDLRLILSVGEVIGLSPSKRRLRSEELQRFTARNPFQFPD